MRRHSRLVPALSAFALLVCSVTGTARAALVPLTFSGGNGTPLVITVPQAITYTVVNDTAANGLFFVFQGTGNVYSGASVVLNGNLGYDVNGGIGTAADRAGTFATGVVTVNDLQLFKGNANPSVALNDVVTLFAGSTSSPVFNLQGPPPPSGLYNTFITDVNGTVLGTGVPEPAGLGILAAATFALLRRRGR